MGRAVQTKDRVKARLSRPSGIKAGHKLTEFACGRPQIDTWLRKHALKAEDAGTARTFVVCRGKTVVGFYALAAGAVAHTDAPGKLRRNCPDPVPVVILARLGVSSDEQGAGLGRALLSDAMKRSAQAAKIIGARALLVHALDDSAAEFYLSLDFLRMQPGTDTLFLSMKNIIASL